MLSVQSLSTEEQYWLIRIFDVIFNVCFTVELGLRLAAWSLVFRLRLGKLSKWCLTKADQKFFVSCYNPALYPGTWRLFEIAHLWTQRERWSWPWLGTGIFWISSWSCTNLKQMALCESFTDGFPLWHWFQSLAQDAVSMYGNGLRSTFVEEIINIVEANRPEIDVWPGKCVYQCNCCSAGLLCWGLNWQIKRLQSAVRFLFKMLLNVSWSNNSH